MLIKLNDVIDHVMTLRRDDTITVEESAKIVADFIQGDFSDLTRHHLQMIALTEEYDKVVQQGIDLEQNRGFGLMDDGQGGMVLPSSPADMAQGTAYKAFALVYPDVADVPEGFDLEVCIKRLTGMYEDVAADFTS